MRCQGHFKRNMKFNIWWISKHKILFLVISLVSLTFILANKDIKNNADKVFFLRFYHCVLLSCPMISSIHCHLIWGMCVEITFWSLANFEHFWRFKKLFVCFKGFQGLPPVPSLPDESNPCLKSSPRYYWARIVPYSGSQKSQELPPHPNYLRSYLESTIVLQWKLHLEDVFDFIISWNFEYL